MGHEGHAHNTLRFWQKAKTEKVSEAGIRREEPRGGRGEGRGCLCLRAQGCARARLWLHVRMGVAVLDQSVRAVGGGDLFSHKDLHGACNRSPVVVQCETARLGRQRTSRATIGDS